MGVKDPDINPLYSGVCPFLNELLERYAVPVDAQLGVPGRPQSATGQTTLLTGINAAERLGRHIEGFPNAALRDIITEHNIFRVLRERGLAVTFANAYFIEDVSQVRKRRWQSVTTVAALAGLGTVRDTTLLLRNEAVYQDLTRNALRERGYQGPLVSPREAGAHLLNIAQKHDFTLFEYFQTDRAGHSEDPTRVEKVLCELDEFLRVVARYADAQGQLFVLISDHGNIEDSQTASHTSNPVPLVAIGSGAQHLQNTVRRLDQFVPAFLELMDLG